MRNVTARLNNDRLATRISIAVCIPLLLAVSLTASEAPVETVIGTEGTYFARYSGPRLEAKPVDEKAPIALRIAEVVNDGATDLYELRFVSQFPGKFDLREYLQRVDGEPISEQLELTIIVHSVLPPDHNGDLEDIQHADLPSPWPYRLSMGLLATVWCLPIAVLVMRWIMSRKGRVDSIEEAEETLADRLRPLISRALAGELTQPEQATLERSLISHWRDRLQLHQCSTVQALQRMREDDEAGELLRGLERWLHQRPPVTGVDVDKILRPYEKVTVPS